MSREITVTVYKFSELSATAKEHAKQEYAELFGYAFADEAIKSLKALAVHFGGKLKGYEVDFFGGSYSQASFEMPEDLTAEEIQEKLDALGTFNPQTLKGNGDCKLTGYCADEDAIDGFRKAWHEGERDLAKLMEAAFESWIESAQADCEAEYTDEAFSEHSNANNYEYDQKGNIISKK